MAALAEQNFYSRPRAGAIRALGIVGHDEGGISTHAPVRGRSVLQACEERMARISTHAPVRGRSRARDSTRLDIIYFYSRPRAGAILPVVRKSWAKI